MRIKEIQVGVEDVVLSDVNTTMNTKLDGITAQLGQLQDSVDNQGASSFEVYSS